MVKYNKSGKPRKPRKKKQTTYKEDLENLIERVEYAKHILLALTNDIYERDIKGTLYEANRMNKTNVTINSNQIMNIAKITDAFVLTLLRDSKDIASHEGRIVVNSDDLYLACKLKNKLMFLSETFDQYHRFSMDQIVQNRMVGNKKKIDRHHPGELVPIEEVRRNLESSLQALRRN